MPRALEAARDDWDEHWESIGLDLAGIPEKNLEHIRFFKVMEVRL